MSGNVYYRFNHIMCLNDGGGGLLAFIPYFRYKDGLWIFAFIVKYRYTYVSVGIKLARHKWLTR